MGWSLFLYWKKLNCSLLLFSVSFRIFIHFRYVLFGLSFSNVSSLHILSLILHGSLYLFLLPFFLKFCNSSASFVWERGWDRSLFLSCESIISIMLFSPSPSLTLFPFRQWKFVKRVSLEGCPKSSLISKTKPAKSASDSSPSALRTLFLQCIHVFEVLILSFILSPTQHDENFGILQSPLLSIVLTTSRTPANFLLSLFFSFSRWFVAIPIQIPPGIPQVTALGRIAAIYSCLLFHLLPAVINAQQSPPDVRFL